MIRFRRLALLAFLLLSFQAVAQTTNPTHTEYLWLEAEDMRGFATQPNNEPVLNPSWRNLPSAQARGWGMNGTGTSAEWTQGGESGWNSAAASADESQATIYQTIEVPRAGQYRIWVRYADWANQTENFVITVSQREHEVFRHEFGTRDLIDVHDEVSMYWKWAFTWDSAIAELEKGPARLSIAIEKPAQARRHVDVTLVTNDLAFVPQGRSKPDFAAMRYLREWSVNRAPLTSLLSQKTSSETPAAWQRPAIAGRDFLMPWNIAPEFWALYDKPPAERPLYPFNAEPLDEFVQKYKGARDVPIFSSKLVVPVIYINALPEALKEGSPFRRYLRETKSPFAVLINYGAASMSDAAGQAAWNLLNGELKDQFLGWISGESIGHVFDSAATELKVSDAMTRSQLLEAYRKFYDNAIARKWSTTFHADTGAMWDKLIPAQSTSSTSFAHALTNWGVRLLGIETAAVQPMFAMRTAFTRGAARQYGANFLYYHAPNFGDTATTFTKAQNFAGPDNFFHSRYGVTMGPSLSWYRKSYYFYYMSGAAAIYLEQGGDQFFKPGPGEHEFQLNPLGRITDEFVRFAEKHPDRGTPYTPIAFLLDPAHGWEMTDYPQWSFGVSQTNRSDSALRELFSVAYFPGSVVQGEPASGDRQAFVNGVFGDIFDVLVASNNPDGKSAGQASSTRADVRRVDRTDKPVAAKAAVEVPTKTVDVIEPRTRTGTDRSVAATINYTALLGSYRAIVVGGRIQWTAPWIKRINAYVKAGGTLVLNAAQVKDFPAEMLGLRLTGVTAEADNARCLSAGEAAQNLNGQMFRYEKLELTGATALIVADSGDALATVNKVGNGSVVFAALPDLLGEDEHVTPFAAHMLAHVFADASPIKVKGDVEYLFNHNSEGWLVTLINNNGVYKPAQGMAQVDRSAVVTATITLPSQEIKSAVDWVSEKSIEVKRQPGGSTINVTIPPGGVSIVQLQTGPSRRQN
ncbi:MAG TPA: hypothetical protein VHR36_17260 [Pyrinomonadaceae bacterium]|nr:hypothetical protein [Pyrinomonadaceae bacterium]